jgi:glycosyltransferase involved in cell wall biosynthesis
LLNQNLNQLEYEIIIIDDGSNDSSYIIASKFSLSHSNINVYKQINKGAGSARNEGLSLAKGDYVYFIDSDDYLATNVLGCILNNAYENELDVLTFLSKKTSSRTSLNSSFSDISKITCTNILSGIDYIAIKGFKNVVWCYIIKREFLLRNDIKFIEGKWMEDAIFTLTSFLKATKVCHLPIDAHRYVITPGSAMTSKEPNHYKKVIFDKVNAIKYFGLTIKQLRNNISVNNEVCLKRLIEKQQIMLFFMMLRILQSNLKISEVKSLIKEMKDIGVYPMTSITGFESDRFYPIFFSRIFNYESVYILTFLIMNPLFRLKYMIFKKHPL